jgi:Ca-activated chloride channel family protein
MLAQSPDPAVTPSRPPLASTEINNVHVGVASVPDARVKSIRVDVNLTLVPVTVTDSTGHPVLGLQKKDLAVFENGAQQDIRHFSTEAAPISVGLIIDTSGSMKDKLDALRAAIDQFFVNANPEDDFFAVTVSSHPQMLGGPSQSIDTIEKRLGVIVPGGNTALFDAIYLGAMQLQHASYPRRALVIISDGADNASRYRFKEIKSMLQESDIEVYAIGLFESSLLKSYEEIVGKKHLVELTASTGGRTLAVANIARMSEAAARISWELRNQYILGYKPQTAIAHEVRRKIKVRFAPPADQSLLQAHYRREYSIPEER